MSDRDLAERIVSTLMTNGFGERADRLVLKSDEERDAYGRLVGGRDLGGWSAAALVDRVERTLAEADREVEA